MDVCYILEEIMEKLKDFIYDKNDIIVAFLVLLLAALLIWWRMGAIMDYPEKLFADENPAGTELESDNLQGDDDFTENTGSDEPADEQIGNDDSGDTQTEVPSDALWQSGVLTRDVEVDVYGNSAMSAVQCLVDEGLFKDYAEYREICDRTGLNHEKVSAGSLLFEKGSTKEDIARKINWS